MSADILLIHPPAVKPGEPPLGTAVLLASLRKKGVAAEAIDANLEGYLHLLDPGRARAAAGENPSTAVRRGIAHISRSLATLRSAASVAVPARYETAVAHLEAALSPYGEGGERLTLGDYVHPELSEFSPADLERAAAAEGTLFARYFRDELLPKVESVRPRIVALSVNYRHQVLPAFELAGILRRAFPEMKIVAGGGMFTSWREPLLRRGERFSCIDRIVFGPGEEPLYRIAAGEATSPFLEGTEATFLPDFSFASLGDYLSPVPVLPLGLSRGCYWRRCLFCPEAAAPTHSFSVLTPSGVASLLEELSARHGAKHFHLTDNAVPLPLLRELAALDRKLGWHGFVRFEPLLGDPGFVRSLAQGGCRMLQLGLESGSPAVLERLGKGTDLATAGKILENLRQAGVAAYVYVLLGTPGETEKDAEATLSFLERYAGSISFLNLAVMNLPRDSAMLENPARFGIAGAGEIAEAEPLGLYRRFTPVGGWGREAARRFLRRRILSSPAIRDIVKRTPSAFTSNHAFLFGAGAGRGKEPAAAL